MYLPPLDHDLFLQGGAKVLGDVERSEGLLGSDAAQWALHGVFVEVICDGHGGKGVPTWQGELAVCGRGLDKRGIWKELQVVRLHGLLGDRALLIG